MDLSMSTNAINDPNDTLDRLEKSNPEGIVWQMLNKLSTPETKSHLAKDNATKMTDAKGRDIIYVLTSGQKKKRTK